MKEIRIFRNGKCNFWFKNLMSTFNTRLETAKEKISELEDIAEKNYAEGGTKRQRDEKWKRLRV